MRRPASTMALCVALAIATLAYGCGRKGPLYLPQEEAPAGAGTAQGQPPKSSPVPAQTPGQAPDQDPAPARP